MENQVWVIGRPLHHTCEESLILRNSTGSTEVTRQRVVRLNAKPQLLTRSQAWTVNGPVIESVPEALRAGLPQPSLYLGLQLERGAAAHWAGVVQAR